MLGRVEVTGGFLLLIAWMNYLDTQLIVPLAMLACALHELGHYLTIRLLGGAVKYIRLTAIGAEMALARPLGYWQEGLAALMGPGVNLMLALIFCTREEGLTFAGVNLVLACFNMMPVGRLDGGRALHCTLALLGGPDLAARVGRWMDCLCTGAILAGGLLLAGVGGNLTLLTVALWLLGVFSSGKSLLRVQNRACQRRRKQVK